MVPCVCGGEFCQTKDPGRCSVCSNYLPADKLGMCPKCFRVACLACIPKLLQIQQQKPDQTMMRPPIPGEQPL